MLHGVWPSIEVRILHLRKTTWACTDVPQATIRRSAHGGMSKPRRVFSCASRQFDGLSLGR
jgi:hypothetical protein